MLEVTLDHQEVEEVVVALEQLVHVLQEIVLAVLAVLVLQVQLILLYMVVEVVEVAGKLVVVKALELEVQAVVALEEQEQIIQDQMHVLTLVVVVEAELEIVELVILYQVVVMVDLVEL